MYCVSDRNLTDNCLLSSTGQCIISLFYIKCIYFFVGNVSPRQCSFSHEGSCNSVYVQSLFRFDPMHDFNWSFSTNVLFCYEFTNHACICQDRVVDASPRGYHLFQPGGLLNCFHLFVYYHIMKCVLVSLIIVILFSFILFSIVCFVLFVNYCHYFV